MNGWEILEVRGARIVRSRALAGVRGFAHAFSTRTDARGDPFDLGGPDDRDSGTEERRRRLADAAGLDGRPVAILRQVHGAGIVPAAGLTVGTEGDAVLWTPADPPSAPAPAVRTADCVPLLLAVPGGAAAAVHAGWRGTVAGIVPAAIVSLVETGASPTSVVAAIGPAIGPCCYPVGGDVAREIARAAAGEGVVKRHRSGESRVDLRAAVRHQLLRAGVRDESIHVAPWCTSCREDLFWSFRRDGTRAGRSMALIGSVSASCP